MHSRHSIRPQYRDYFIDNQAYMTVCLARRDEISSEKKTSNLFSHSVHYKCSANGVWFGASEMTYIVSRGASVWFGVAVMAFVTSTKLCYV